MKSYISYTQLKYCLSQQGITAITAVNHKHFVKYFRVQCKNTTIITIQPGIQDDKVLTPILAVGWLSRSPVLLRPPAYLHICIFAYLQDCIYACCIICMFAYRAGAPLFCFYAFINLFQRPALIGPVPEPLLLVRVVLASQASSEPHSLICFLPCDEILQGFPVTRV